MLVTRRRVRNIHAYLGGLIPHTDIKFVADLAQVAQAKLTRSGFDGRNDGDQLLPPPVGPITKFNSEGRWEIHRDQPKESRFIGRREWTREEWAGHGQTNTVTTSVDIYRECYPRSLVPPPAVELTVVDHNGSRLVVSDALTWQVTPPDAILHVLNLMLELFGEVEVRHQDLASFLPPQTQRVNWTLLPPGNTVAGVTAHVHGEMARTPVSFRGPITARLTYLAGKNPSEVYLGHGGFHAYVAYVFPNTGNTILESVMPDNATYVFAGNWQQVSHLTKSQVLAGNHNIDRIIHDANWEAHVSAYAH